MAKSNSLALLLLVVSACAAMPASVWAACQPRVTTEVVACARYDDGIQNDTMTEVVAINECTCPVNVTAWAEGHKNMAAMTTVGIGESQRIHSYYFECGMSPTVKYNFQFHCDDPRRHTKELERRPPKSSINEDAPGDVERGGPVNEDVWGDGGPGREPPEEPTSRSFCPPGWFKDNYEGNVVCSYRNNSGRISGSMGADHSWCQWCRYNNHDPVCGSMDCSKWR